MASSATTTVPPARSIADVLGAEGAAWNDVENQWVRIFGYPGEPPFDGQTLQACDGTEFNWSSYQSNTVGVPCNFTGGASGGPWLVEFDGSYGYINGLNSFTAGGSVGSPYFGDNFATLYSEVEAMQP
jgi:hypothetical protein